MAGRTAVYAAWSPKQERYEPTRGMHFAAEHTSSSAPEDHWGCLQPRSYLPQDGWVTEKRAVAPETCRFQFFTQVPQVPLCQKALEKPVLINRTAPHMKHESKKDS